MFRKKVYTSAEIKRRTCLVIVKEKSVHLLITSQTIRHKRKRKMAGSMFLLDVNTHVTITTKVHNRGKWLNDRPHWLRLPVIQCDDYKNAPNIRRLQLPVAKTRCTCSTKLLSYRPHTVSVSQQFPHEHRDCVYTPHRPRMSSTANTASTELKFTFI